MSVTRDQLQELRKEVPFKWRQGPGGIQLPYIDARQVMDLLDDVLGPENWKEEHPRHEGETLYWGISVLINGEWITKWDCGSQSAIESQKGQASDAFKRAAVKWGIGRFLYQLKNDINPSPGQASDSQIKRMYAIGYKECGYSYDDIDKALERKGLQKSALSVSQVDQFIKTMQDNPKKAA